MEKLPIDDFLPEVLDALNLHNKLVLVASPGAGKTTRVAPYLWQQGAVSQEKEIVLLQPRRVAARTCAKRIAEEQGYELGSEIGYQIRFENKTSNKTKIRVVTEGILVRQILADPELKKVGAILLDEFHERNIYSDLTLTLLKELQLGLREDLKIVVMSATLDSEKVSRFLDGAPVITVPGRIHEITTHYLNRSLPLKTDDHFIDAVTEQVQTHILKYPNEKGHVLVFLPGMSEIQRCLSRMESFAQSQRLLTLPLHGSLTNEQQDLALKSTPQRKIIFSTNIAETSLTIDGVDCVIDSGLARVLRMNSKTGLEMLELSRICLASADQRRGRSGRQKAGVCYRMWSKQDESALNQFEIPEIQRVDLCETLLLLSSWGISDFKKYDWFDAPPEQNLQKSLHTLKLLGALNEKNQILEHGRALLQIPLQPRLSNLLIWGKALGLSEDACLLAALLSEKDILLNEAKKKVFSHLESDVLLRLELLKENSSYLHRAGAQGVRRSAEQLEKILSKVSCAYISKEFASLPLSLSLPKEDQLKSLILLSFCDRLSRRRRPDNPQALMVGGRGIVVDEVSSVKKSELFVCIDTFESFKNGISESRTTMASAVTLKHLESFLPQFLEKQTAAIASVNSNTLQVQEALCFFDLPVEEPKLKQANENDVFSFLVDKILTDWEELLRLNTSFQKWLVRLTKAKECYAHLSWPNYEDQKVRRDFAKQICYGEKKLGTIYEKNLIALSEAALGKAEREILKKQFPDHLVLPNGKVVMVEYFLHQPPQIELRIQDAFGWKKAPQLAEGKLPLTLVLLAPNHRPAQITNDLEGFWSGSYHEVKKDLKSRYPKHAWPDDPANAPPKMPFKK